MLNKALLISGKMKEVELSTVFYKTKITLGSKDGRYLGYSGSQYGENSPITTTDFDVVGIYFDSSQGVTFAMLYGYGKEPPLAPELIIKNETNGKALKELGSSANSGIDTRIFMGNIFGNLEEGQECIISIGV